MIGAIPKKILLHLCLIKNTFFSIDDVYDFFHQKKFFPFNNLVIVNLVKSNPN